MPSYFHCGDHTLYELLFDYAAYTRNWPRGALLPQGQFVIELIVWELNLVNLVAGFFELSANLATGDSCGMNVDVVAFRMLPDRFDHVRIHAVYTAAKI